MRKPLARPLALVLSTIASILVPSRAMAFEHQWQAGASAGYVALLGENPTQHGLGGGLHLTYGLTDALNLLVELDASSHFGRAAPPPDPNASTDAMGRMGASGAPQKKEPLPGLMLLSGGVGIGYVVDVLQWVPYIGLLAGAADRIRFDGCGNEYRCNTVSLSLAAPFGLDYTLSRSFLVGFSGRYQLLIGGGEPMAQVLSLSARVAYTWGY